MDGLIALALAKKQMEKITAGDIIKDWNENNPSSAQYIENRPFYYIDGEKEEIILINENVKFKYEEFEGNFGAYNLYFKTYCDYPIKEGMTIDYNISGYSGSAKLSKYVNEETNESIFYIVVNGAILIGFEDNFLSIAISDTSIELDEKRSVYISIYDNSTHKISSNFLPPVVGYTKDKSSEGEIFNDYINNEAKGLYSHAQGRETEAEGDYSHTEGLGTVALGEAQHVQGKYNEPNEDYAHILGGGSDESDRRNIHTVDWDGNAWFAGSMSFGGANPDEGMNLEDYINEVVLASLEVDIDEINNTLDEALELIGGE